MGKRNSKLKQDTIDKLIEDTYCKLFKNIFYAILNKCSDFFLFFFLTAPRQRIFNDNSTKISIILYVYVKLPLKKIYFQWQPNMFVCIRIV